MKTKAFLVVAGLLAVLGGGLLVQLGSDLAVAQEVPAPPVEEELAPEKLVDWQRLPFHREIPSEWGPVISINRAQRGGECYTLWFLDEQGTLRGVTTRSFTGPNRGTFFPEVYTVRRRSAAAQTPTVPASLLPTPDRPAAPAAGPAPQDEVPPPRAAPADKPQPPAAAKPRR